MLFCSASISLFAAICDGNLCKIDSFERIFREKKIRRDCKMNWKFTCTNFRPQNDHVYFVANVAFDLIQFKFNDFNYFAVRNRSLSHFISTTKLKFKKPCCHQQRYISKSISSFSQEMRPLFRLSSCLYTQTSKRMEMLVISKNSAEKFFRDKSIWKRIWIYAQRFFGIKGKRPHREWWFFAIIKELNVASQSKLT